MMGAILNCCLAQNWFFDKVLCTHDFREMHRLAAEVAPGCDGLFFLPYLTGERTPHHNPEARGVFFGLTLGHDRASMTRAVVEGVSYAIVDAMDCILQFNPDIDRLILSGGGARSPLWKQIVSDMLDRPIANSSRPSVRSMKPIMRCLPGARKARFRADEKHRKGLTAYPR